MIEKVIKYAMTVGSGFQTYLITEDGREGVRYENEEILQYIEDNGIDGEIVNR